MQLSIDRETEEQAAIDQWFILGFLTPEQIFEELKASIWRHRDGESYWSLYFKSTMRAASKQRNGLYPIKRPKPVLRCDRCRKMAFYAEYTHLWLLCQEHAQAYPLYDDEL